MSGLFPIIVFVIVILIIRNVAQKAAPSSKKRPTGSGDTLGDILQQAIRSTSNEKWMAAAGALKSRYIRPASGKAPSIEGQYHDLKFQIFLVHPNATNVSCRIEFPENIDKDLLIVYEKNGQVAQYFRKHPMLTDFDLPGRIGGSAANPHWFREYLAKGDRSGIIKSMIHYLQSFKITDSGVVAVFDTKDNSPDVPMIKVLLQDIDEHVYVRDAQDTISLAVEDNTPVEPVIAPEAKIDIDEPVIVAPVAPMPEVAAPKPVTVAPMPEVAMPKPVFSAAPSTFSASPKNIQTQAPQAVDLSLEQQAFCDALFSKSIPGKMENEAFAAVKGKTVEWCGTLLSSYDFTFDFAFGNRKGVKATFLLCEVTGNGSLKQKVKVHVAFPAELSAELKQKRNEKFAFRGTLLKMEAFSREIYIDNGELI